MMKKGVENNGFIKWFSDLGKNDWKVAGYKGANVSELYNFGILVPSGFVITSSAYDCFFEFSGLKSKIKKILEGVNYDDISKLEEVSSEIRREIINSKFPKEMEDEILEAYGDLDVQDLDIENASARDILNTSSEPVFVAVRSSAIFEDSSEFSYSGQYDSFMNVKGNYELFVSIKRVFASFFSSRAISYRHRVGMSEENLSFAVVIQRMVDSFKSGVVYSKDFLNNDDNIVIEAVFGLGESVVSGSVIPDSYVVSPDLNILNKKISRKKIAVTRNSGGGQQIVKLTPEKGGSQVLNEYEIKKISDLAVRLEKHYGCSQSLEFVIENEDIYILQSKAFRKNQENNAFNMNFNGMPLLEGDVASSGVAYGNVRVVNSYEDLKNFEEGDILVCKFVSPEMAIMIEKCSALITEEGGISSYYSIMCREFDKPCIVAVGDAISKLVDGDLVSVDGFNGKIYAGKVLEGMNKKEIVPVMVNTNTKIKLVVDFPSSSKSISKIGIRSVGLAKLEGIVAGSGKHPDFFWSENKLGDYENIIFSGINEISNYFEEIWVRGLDMRSDEYKNLEGKLDIKEANPILGVHGIRYGLKHLNFLRAEFLALKRVADKGKKLGIIIPNIISIEELKSVKELLKEMNFLNVKLGISIETPASVQLIKNFCLEGIDFVSLNVSKLTQHLLAVDVENDDLGIFYDEMHPSVLHQLEYVLRVCSRSGVETNFYGDCKNREMIKFLIERGVDSFSFEPNCIEEVVDYIISVEKKMVENTDMEPRRYKPSLVSGEEIEVSEIKNDEKGNDLGKVEEIESNQVVGGSDGNLEKVEELRDISVDIGEDVKRNNEEKVEIVEEEGPVINGLSRL